MFVTGFAFFQNAILIKSKKILDASCHIRACPIICPLETPSLLHLRNVPDVNDFQAPRSCHMAVDDGS